MFPALSSPAAFGAASVAAFGAAFLVAFVGALPVAGPVAVLVVERSLAGDARGATRLALGAAVPEAIYAAGAAAGAQVLLSRWPELVVWSGLAAAAVLVALAGALLRAQSPAPVQRAPGRTAFVLTVLNPTLLVTWGTVAGVVTALGGLATPGASVTFGLGAGLGGLMGTLVLGRLAAAQRHRLGPHRERLVRRAAAALLLGLAAWTAWGAVP